MKRFIGSILALVLLLALIYPAIALASEAVPVEPEEDEEDYDRWSYSFYEYFSVESAEEFVEMWSEYHTLDGTEEVWEWFAYSKEDFMSTFSMTEEEYLILEAAWNKAVEEAELHRIKEFEDLGGTYGIVNVMYNGTFIVFEDAVPEIIDNSVFVPVKPFFEELGAKPGYDGDTGTVTAVLPGMTVSFVLGSDSINVTEDGVVREQTVGAVSYAKDGVSYIQLRGLAEALGLFAVWDRAYRTVVVIDLESLITEIDKDFTIVNRMMDMTMQAPTYGEGTLKTVLDLLVAITMFDSLDGDAIMKISANIVQYSDGSNYYMRGVIDLSELLGLLTDELMFDGYDEEEIAQIAQLLSALSDMSVEIIINYDEEIMYLRVPFLSTLFGALGLELEIPKDAWISMPVINELTSGISASDILLSDFLIGIADIGESIGETIVYDGIMRYYDRIYIYKDIRQSAKEMESLIGDRRFRKDGNKYSLSLSADDLYSSFEDMGTPSYYDPRISIFDFDVVVTMSGDTIAGFTGNLLYRNETYYSTLQYTMTFDISSDKLSIFYEMHEKNEMKVSMTLESTTVETNEPIPAGPPSGDVVISLEDLFGDLIGGPQPEPLTPMSMVP